MKRKRMKEKVQSLEQKRDCLSELPEPLLHHILSFLSMKDVIRTSVLAKRWTHIWSFVPCLTFMPLKMIRSKEVGFINRSLLLHKGPKIQKFNLTFKYSTEGLLVDSWIHFALIRSVNELYLDCKRNDSSSSKYRLPDFIFSCRSLTVLALKSCIIELPTKFNVSSLKTLSFEEVRFSGGAINDLLSSCPILEHLSFTRCELSHYHDLVIMNASVKTLKMKDGYTSPGSKLEIHAPFIVSFELTQSLYWKYYVIKRMKSLVSASFVCGGFVRVVCFGKSDHNIFSILENLDDLCHVKDLRLCSCHLQAASSFDSTEGPIMEFVFFNATCLRLQTGLAKWELPGIAYILSHSPNVETLFIGIDEIGENGLKDNFEDGEFWKHQEPNFRDRLCNVRTVKIYNFMKNLNVLESTHTSCTAKVLLEKLQNDMNFLRFLLKNSKVLERMIITTCKKVKFVKSEGKKLKLLFQLTQELLAFPRASRDAEISFC